MIKATILSLVVVGSLISGLPAFAAPHGTDCSIARQSLNNHSAGPGQNYYQDQLDHCSR